MKNNLETGNGLSIADKIEIIQNSERLEQVTLQALPDVHTEEYYFVSYSHKDYKEVYTDVLRLQEQGLEVWYDRGLPAGLDWEALAEEHLAKYNCMGVIFYLSENALKSDAILTEIRTALYYAKNSIAVVLPAESGKARGKILSPVQLLQHACPNISPRSEKFRAVSAVFSDNVIYLPYDTDAALKAEKIRLLRRPPLFGVEDDDWGCGLVLSFVRDMNLKVADIPECFETEEQGYLGTVDNVGPGIFANCLNLTEVNFHNPIYRLGDYAFWHCVRLSKIDLSNVDFIGARCFGGCVGLKSVNLQRAYAVDRFAFEKCKNLRSVVFGKRLKELFAYAFDHCTSLADVQFHPECPLKILRTGTFFFCDLRSVQIPKNVEEIEDSTFVCKNLTEIKFAQGSRLKRLQGGSLCGQFEVLDLSPCEGLTEILPEAIHSPNMRRLVLPKSIKRLGAFSDKRLAEHAVRVEFCGTVAEFCAIEQFDLHRAGRGEQDVCVPLAAEKLLQNRFEVVCADGTVPKTSKLG